MLQEYLLFLSLILSGFSQSLIQNACDTTFGVQSVEYICNGTGITLQWIVEPVIVADTSAPNSVRFANSLISGGSVRVENMVATLDSVTPFISRLRIEAVSTLNQANVVCTTQSGSVSLPYTRNNYVPRIPVSGFINRDTRKEDFVTLDLTPSTSTDVDFYAVANSQNDEMVLVEASQNSGTIEVTIPVARDSVVFNVTTQYLCGHRIPNSDTYSVGSFVPPTTTGRSILGVGFLIWAIIATIIAIIALIAVLLFLLVLLLKLRKICVMRNTIEEQEIRITKLRNTIEEKERKNKELLDVKEKNDELLSTIEIIEIKYKELLDAKERKYKELLDAKERKINELLIIIEEKERKIKELKEKGRKKFNMGGVEP